MKLVSERNQKNSITSADVYHQSVPVFNFKVLSGWFSSSSWQYCSNIKFYYKYTAFLNFWTYFWTDPVLTCHALLFRSANSGRNFFDATAEKMLPRSVDFSWSDFFKSNTIVWIFVGKSTAERISIFFHNLLVVDTTNLIGKNIKDLRYLLFHRMKNGKINNNRLVV